MSMGEAEPGADEAPASQANDGSPGDPPAGGSSDPPVPKEAKRPGSAGAFQHCLTMSTRLSLRLVGEIQGGWRLDLDYECGKGNSIVATPALKDTTRRRLAGATIVSGSDWAFVSTDATVDFDARLTIKMAGPGDKAWFLAGRIRGRADLRECRRKTGAPRFPDGVETHDVLTAWKAGFGAGAFLPLTLGVSIDVPEKGFDPDETRCYEDCRELGRTLFIGMGRVTFQDGPNGAPESIELDLHRWRPPVKIASNKSQVVPSKARRGGV